ncbi:hypothetical protein ACIF85_47165 [Streptomyces sp. NPDC086033]|uniref:hypothetical protein n=1 Tax=Streptomyces sp. NPDC086033 TaxID=3365747 RepID=UPI0037D0C2E2
MDLVDVIGSALVAKAAGAGARTIATVLGWLRRFDRRAEDVRGPGKIFVGGDHLDSMSGSFA